MDKVIVQRDGEPDIDVTEAVKTMYDLLYSSMDWGSSFLSIEDVSEVTRLAEVCGFVNLEGAQEQLVAYLSSLEGRCPICSKKSALAATLVLGEVTEQGRIVRLQYRDYNILKDTKDGVYNRFKDTYDEHHAILVQPRHAPAYLYWPDLETT